MKISKEIYEALCWDKEVDGFEVVDDSDWIDEGKYQLRTIVVEHVNKFYSTAFGRTGDAWSGYELDLYDDTYELQEVVPKEVTKIVYEPLAK